MAEREDARARLLRGWTEAAGPTTAAALGVRVGLSAEDIDRGMRMLESNGFVLRGRFTPGLDDDEYCDRRLLARIHRYTLKRLRREIEPVAPRDFMRFLFDWQRVAPGARVSANAPFGWRV